MVAAPAAAMASGMARAVVRAANVTNTAMAGVRLADTLPRAVVDDIFSHALKKQTGVSLKYMLDFGANPIERQLILSSQFLHRELPVRLAHRVAELENLPYGLSTKDRVTKVRHAWTGSHLLPSTSRSLQVLRCVAPTAACVCSSWAMNA